jgi:predicted alpha-1,6-mannanase (GH76 family)
MGAAFAAVPPEQAEKAIQAFNKAYWNTTNKTFYKRDGKSGTLDFWLSAHAWETIMDAYALTGKPEYKQQIGDVYDGFVKMHGTDWTTNDYNDDIAWWVIACTHAYKVTGETRYLNQAKTHFDWLWKNERDSVQGGIWWKNNEHKSKNSCVVQPVIISAVNLANLLKDDGYRVKAESLFAWQKRTLTDPKNPGKVYDAINVSGSLGTGSTTYNQGTYIGSAVGLGHMTDARVAADWTKKNMCNTAGVVREAQQGDFAAFKLILVRYVIEYARKNGTAGAADLAWMETNATSVWNNRRTADDVTGFDWNAAAPTTGIESASAASGVTLLAMLATPTTISIRPVAQGARGMESAFAFPGNVGSGAGVPAVRFNGALRSVDGRAVDLRILTP